MKMYSARCYLNAIAIFIMLMIGAGCAQHSVNVTDSKSSEGTLPVTIQAVNVAADASQVDISVSQPGTFTFYKVSDPPKAVIDLAETDPGNFKPMDVNSGIIKRIDATKHVFGGGFLTRLEISLTNDVDFNVNVDPNVNNKLVVKFAPQAKDAPAVTASASTSKPSTIDAAPMADTAPVQSDVPVKKEENQPVAAPASKQVNADVQPARNPISEVKPDVGTQQKVVTAVNVVQDGIEVDVAGGVETYNVFKMTKPDRLVLDIFGARTSIAANSVQINSFGIGKARIGLSPDKVRIVFDPLKDSIPSYEVTKRDRGVKVTFGETRAVAPVKSQPVIAEDAPKSVAPAKPAQVAGPSVLESIDFKIEDGVSRIAMKISGNCSPGKPVRSAKGLTLSIANCQIPRNLQRTLDTSSFASSVLKITPYQAKIKSGYDARIVLKLRSDAPSELKQEGNTVFWDIKNVGITESALMAEVTKPQSAERRSAADADSLISEKSLQKSSLDKKNYTGRRVTLEFSDADVRKIFQLIAEVSNLNFLIADDVTGTISIKLVNVPWDQALDVILESKGLEMKRDGNIVQIKPKGKFVSQEQELSEATMKREKSAELKTVVWDVNYSSLADVKKQLETLKSSNTKASITEDARSNRIIITDIEEKMPKYRELLEKLDIPEKQVMIEARIVEATSTFTRDIGVQWGIHYRDGSASFLGINQLDTGFGGVVTPPPNTGFPDSKSPGGAIGVSFGKLTSNIQVDMRLSAAAAAGLIKIVSTPKVVTINNKAAKISQGQSIPYQTVSAEGTKTEFVEAALTLEVTPHITADGNISMKIKASNNSAGVGNPPPINKKEATTELQVKNGETTVIGGIYVDNDLTNDQGVPFLSDIPLIGWLFKSTTKSKVKTELLIFITPKIVS